MGAEVGFKYFDLTKKRILYVLELMRPVYILGRLRRRMVYKIDSELIMQYFMPI